MYLEYNFHQIIHISRLPSQKVVRFSNKSGRCPQNDGRFSGCRHQLGHAYWNSSSFPLGGSRTRSLCFGGTASLNYRDTVKQRLIPLIYGVVMTCNPYYAVWDDNCFQFFTRPSRPSTAHTREIGGAPNRISRHTSDNMLGWDPEKRV